MHLLFKNLDVPVSLLDLQLEAYAEPRLTMARRQLRLLKRLWRHCQRTRLYFNLLLQHFEEIQCPVLISQSLVSHQHQDRSTPHSGAAFGHQFLHRIFYTVFIYKIGSNFGLYFHLL